MPTPARFLSSAGLAALLFVAACGGSDDASSAGSSPPAAESAAVLENSEVSVEGAALVQLGDDPSADGAVGVAAPVITGADFDGEPVTIGGATDGPTMLVFLAHWCPHCNDEIPELNELRDTEALPAGLNVVGVSTAVASDRPNYPPSAWIVEKDWTWPVLADSVASDAFQLYGGSGFPFIVMLDADGNVLGRTAGSSSAAQIDAWIDSVLQPTN